MSGRQQLLFFATETWQQLQKKRPEFEELAAIQAGTTAPSSPAATGPRKAPAPSRANSSPAIISAPSASSRRPDVSSPTPTTSPARPSSPS